MFLSLITLSILGGAFAQVPAIGSCPQVQTVPTFDVSKFTGRWYENRKFFAIFEVAGKCITADYSVGEAGQVKVVNNEVTLLGNSSIEGTASIPNAAEPGKLKVRLNVGLLHPESDYWILGTDYESYAVIYSCVELPLLNFQFAWILTRERNPPQSVLEKALEVATTNNLDTSRFMETDQKNC